MCHTIKFIKGWGNMLARKGNKYLFLAHHNLEEVHNFIKEDLYNVTLQEEARKLDTMV